MEALEASARQVPAGTGGADRPLQLDLYPFAEDAGDGYVAVVRVDPRHDGNSGGDSRGAGSAGARVETLLRRVEALIGRTETLPPAGRHRAAPRRLLGSVRRRMFLVDWSQVRHFELRSGRVYAAVAGGETYQMNYTLQCIQARVNPRDFFRISRNVIVNLSHVVEIERYGGNRLRVLLAGPDAPSFVASRRASAALRTLLRC